ncbi:PilZ domain-containing protein [Thiocystis violacea]|uniref:PilZ domain-containing protein n=1 Tax=Thiocystis violacea TaxID=13725 RepID=UPI00190648ED|nr:PilZ domain-containing protein [Thiocystis violacea]MBK1721334.1 pilus assembly protein PilZ [Thiocystis violacea]
MNPVSERRLYPRLPMEVEVELHWPGHPLCIARTEDLSNGGVLLILNGEERPPVGAEVRVRVAGLLGGDEQAPMVAATVVRHADEGVAVRFTDDV